MPLTQEMADDFNGAMLQNGCAFRVFKAEGNDYAWEISIPVDPFEAHRPMVYPNREYYRLLEQHYGQHGIVLSYNNAATRFWTNDR